MIFCSVCAERSLANSSPGNLNSSTNSPPLSSLCINSSAGCLGCHHRRVPQGGPCSQHPAASLLCFLGLCRCTDLRFPPAQPAQGGLRKEVGFYGDAGAQYAMASFRSLYRFARPPRLSLHCRHTFTVQIRKFSLMLFHGMKNLPV